MRDLVRAGATDDTTLDGAGPPSTEPPSRRWTVILVDDAADVRDLVRAALSSTTTWRVLAAINAAEARGLLRAVQADVLLVDDQMPGETGTELLASLSDHRELGRATAILLTARRTSILPRGAAGIIEKPFDPFTLASRVAVIVAEHRVRLLDERRARGTPPR